MGLVVGLSLGLIKSTCQQAIYCQNMKTNLLSGRYSIPTYINGLENLHIVSRISNNSL